MSIDDRLRTGLRRNGDAITDDSEVALDAIWLRRRRRLQARGFVAGGVLAAAAALTPWVVGRSAPPGEVVARPSPPVLVGTWTVDVTAPRGDELAGRWIVLIGSDGRVDLDPPAGFPERLAQGHTLETTGTRLRTNVFVDHPGCQLPDAAIGQYNWDRSGSTVTFRVISDECETRRLLFAGRWQAT